METQRDGVKIGTVSGGIVNFGGAVIIQPISVTKSTTDNEGSKQITNSGTFNINQKKMKEIFGID